MTYIDFELLRRERVLDPFSFAPSEVERNVGFTAEVMRDNSRSNSEVVAATGGAACRVQVADPTPRLRQRLAILGWLPFHPAEDAIWYVDEPIRLDAKDNYLVSSFVAQYYAEGMNLLYAPNDGMFSGGAFRTPMSGDASPERLRAHLMLLAERAFIGQSICTPKVPAAWFASAFARVVKRANAERVRVALPPLVLPTRATLRCWLSEFETRHRDRQGTGPLWRSYERTF